VSITEVIKHLLSKCEALSSIPDTTKKKRKKEKKRERVLITPHGPKFLHQESLMIFACIWTFQRKDSKGLTFKGNRANDGSLSKKAAWHSNSR
jgi:hypothetical protein